MIKESLLIFEICGKSLEKNSKEKGKVNHQNSLVFGLSWLFCLNLLSLRMLVYLTIIISHLISPNFNHILAFWFTYVIKISKTFPVLQKLFRLSISINKEFVIKISTYYLTLLLISLIFDSLISLKIRICHLDSFIRQCTFIWSLF